MDTERYGASASDLKPPLASVAMLTYNHGAYIRESIEAVLAQVTTFSFELVIAEDCSTDDTRAIAQQYQKMYPHLVRVIATERNVGFRENLRRLELACRGRYVAYCEGDDYWHEPHKLARQVAFLEDHPQYCLVHSDYRVLHAESGKLEPSAVGEVGNLDDACAFDEIISGRRWVMTLTACVRRSVLSSILSECEEVYSSRFLMGDTQRWLELARRGKVKYLPEVLATHQLIPESASQSRSPDKRLRFALSAKDVLDHYMDKYGCSAEARKSASIQASMNVLACAYEAADAQAAMAVFGPHLQPKVWRQPLVFFYFVGSQSHWHRRMVRPLVSAMRLMSRAAKKIDQWKASVH
jgi:glycosyltransferase involved in cell wall biosynthesis